MIAAGLAARPSGRTGTSTTVDSVHFADLLVVAVRFGVDGAEQPLAVVEGSTDNATLVTERFVSPRE